MDYLVPNIVLCAGRDLETPCLLLRNITKWLASAATPVATGVDTLFVDRNTLFIHSVSHPPCSGDLVRLHAAK